uniref:PALM2 and AKAP2 fusion n=1 Tax=Latimeria chalumnae TaxID=7897 RepID=H3B6N7_LATCH
KTSSQIPENESELKKERDRHSANFLDPTCAPTRKERKMEIEVPLSESQNLTLVTSADAADNQGDFFPSVTSHNGFEVRHESLDSDVAKEIRYLDEVLEANCYESTMENSFNGTSSPEPSTITVDGSGPSISVSDDSATTGHEVIVVGRKQSHFTEHQETTKAENQPSRLNGLSSEEPKEDNLKAPHSPSSSISSRRSSGDGETALTIIRKEAKFELRAFHEEKKPSKLFDEEDDKDKFRVRKVRPSEEVAELERERRELIKSQAVKKNPSIATKWWNPPLEKSIEEQLDQEHLESHKKYQERKQKKQEVAPLPTSPNLQPCPFLPSETTSIKKDIVTEQIDFSAARKQFLMMENTSQSNSQVGPKRSVTPTLYSAKPFVKMSEPIEADRPVASVTMSDPATACGETLHVEANEVTIVKAQKVRYIPEEGQVSTQEASLEQMKGLSNVTGDDSKSEQVSKPWADDGDFTYAKAVLTMVKDEDISDHFSKSVIVSPHAEELDSGLDELSLRSQDTTVLETLSNDFSMDNISDSGASNDTMNTYHDNSLGDFSQPQTPQAETPMDCRTESISKSFSDHGFYPVPAVYPDTVLTEEQLEYHAGILVQNAIQQAISEQNNKTNMDVPKNFEKQIGPGKQQEEVKSPQPSERQASGFEPPQVSSPVQEKRDIVPKKSVEKDLELKESGHSQHPPIPEASQSSTAEENRQEFSYFSKYSQAAELRSTASVLAAQETEVTVGPFKLRSRKQRTLCMIEEEIRAAQEREEELKKQRQNLKSMPSPVRKTASTLPTRTIHPGKTAPGKV